MIWLIVEMKVRLLSSPDFFPYKFTKPGQVLDPQAALLTTAEVHQFLSSNPPRPKQQKIGTYKPVDLNNYNVIRDDVRNRHAS